MDAFNSDIALSVIQYLNVIDSGRFAQTSKRFYYLVHEYRRFRGPQLAAAASDNGTNNDNSSNRSSSSSSSGHITGLGPAVGTTAAPAVPEKTAKELYQCALQKLQTKPNLVLAFNTLRCSRQSSLHLRLPSLVPSNAIILGAVARSIQSSNVVDDDDAVEECSISNANLMLASMPKNVQIKPFSLPGGCSIRHVRDFLNQLQQEDEEQQQQQQQSHDSSCWWKVFIVYATQDEDEDIVQHFIDALQHQYPNAVIVGGICAMAYVSLPTDGVTLEDLEQLSLHQLLRWCNGFGNHGDAAAISDRTLRGMTKQDLVNHVYSLVQSRRYRLEFTADLDHNTGHINNTSAGMMGIAFGGGNDHDVPVRSVVSRGVVSLTSGTVLPSKGWFVNEASFHQPGEADYLISQWPRSYYLIRSIRDESSAGKTWTPNELCRSKGQPDYLGISLARTGDAGVGGGFELHAPHPFGYQLDAFIIHMKNQEQQQSPQQQQAQHQAQQQAAAPAMSTCALTNAPVDLFGLNGDACIEDLEWMLEELASTCREHQEEILGAVMYSCSGRGGPTTSALMRGETMADANRFAHVFNSINHDGNSSSTVQSRNVPCLGFYANGEIGPVALAGRHRRPTSTRQASQASTAAMTTTTPTIFQRGGVVLQRFTVVLALFVVPIFDLSSSSPVVNDSLDNVHAYFAQSHTQQQEQAHA